MKQEWPLIIFTVALQLSCGLCLSITFLERSRVAVDQAIIRPLALAIFPVTLIGLLASVFHLGRPLSAVRSLSNLGQSPLSLEVLLCLLFACLSLAYSYLWWRPTPHFRFAAGMATSVAGLAAVASSFAIYLTPTQPVWNSAWLPVSFLGSVLLFAGIVPCSLLDLSDGRSVRTLLAFGAAGGITLLVSALWMMSRLAQASPDEFLAQRLYAALRLLGSEYSVWLGLYLFLGVVIPLAFAFRLWVTHGAGAAAHPEAFPLKVIVFFAVVSASLIGRMLMYSVGLTPPF
jgi:anaerobic dimethyl sulfoxide reductase subunit C